MTSQPVFEAPATGVLYHYTARGLAQEMSMAGQIIPGQDGLIYLTDVLYKLGWQATDRLALPEKNAEVAIPIPYQALPMRDDGSPAIEYLVHNQAAFSGMVR